MKRMALMALALLTPTLSAAANLRVIDGDTIEMNGETIRLLNIDTPETFRPQCARERAIGLAAKARLVGLLARGKVTVERDGKDRYRRTLAVVKVDGRDVGAVLLAEGHALPYVPGPEAKAQRMAAWCP
jgi:micrococcal nuclease